MRIGLDLHDLLRFAHLAAPHLAKAHVEALVARQAIEHGRRLAAQRDFIGFIGDRHARVVGDVLAQGQRAVDVVARQGAVAVVLLGQRIGLGGEVLAVGRGPPVAQVAVAIGLAALVVETVADFMADDGADGAIVDGVVRVGVEERRLQDGRGEDDFIHRRAVIGVHRLRRHAPLFAVDRFAQLGHLARGTKISGAHHVAHQVALDDLQLRVIAPFVRIGDLRRELGQLGLRFFLGFRAHPVQRVDAVLVGGQHVFHQFLHVRLALCREILRDIQFADGFAQHAFDGAHATLPARLVLRHATEYRAVEGKALVDEVFRQVAGIAAQQLPFEIRFQGVQVGASEHLVVAGQVAGLVDDDVIDLVGDAQGSQAGLQVVAGGQVIELVDVGLVVAFHGVAVLDLGPLHFGQGRFQGHYRLGVRSGVLVAGHGQHFFHVRLVFFFHASLLGFQVVVAVGHAQAALAHIRGVFGGGARILAHVDGVRGRHARLAQVGDQGGHALLVAQRADAVQFAGQRLRAQRVEAGFIHVAGVQVADFLRFGTGLLVLVLLRGFDDAAQLWRGVIAQLGERTPARLVGRNLGRGQPLAIQMGEKVVLHAHGRVDVLHVDAGNDASGGRCGAWRHGRCRHGGYGFGGMGKRSQQGQGQTAQEIAIHGLSLWGISKKTGQIAAGG